MSDPKPTPAPNRIVRAFNALWQNPIVVKELRSRMRRRRSYVILTVYLVLVAGITSLVYFGIASANEFYPDPDLRRTLGQAIFATVVLLQLTAINFVSPAFTAGSISSERENQTYDLLRTTPVSAGDIVRGKFLSGLLFMLLLLIASMPVQSMAFLFGGIELPEFLISSLMLLVTAITFSAIGIYFSSLLKRSTPATVLAYVVSNSAIFGLPILLFIVGVFFPASIDLFDLDFQEPNLVWTIILIAIGWVFLSSNPVSAAIISEGLLLEDNALFLYKLDLTNKTDIYILSPWIGFVTINLLIAWFFYRKAIKRVARKDKK